MLPLALGLLIAMPQGDPPAQPSQKAAEESSHERGMVRLDHWPAMQAAADEGLGYLSRNQSARGYWQGHVGHKQMDNYLILSSADKNEARGQGHMGVTALAGMAFLAGGHLPSRGRYGEIVQRAVDYMLDHVGDNGLISDGGTRMYSHAFATLFLAEVHGMGGTVRVREGLERAIHIIIDCQNAQGGWRYNAFSQEADLSVTVCQLQALRAARNIGISVPKSTIDAAVAYVGRSRTRRGPYQGLYFYKIRGRGAYEKNREYAINAAALTSLFTSGVHDPDLFEPVLAFLDEAYPKVADWYPDHYYYWYGNYYACQAFFQAGTNHFGPWYERLSRDLLRSQRSDGRWTNDVGPGDVFATAVACVMLQIPKQYLPIFQR